MGQKVNPHLVRLQKIYSWDSRWFSQKQYKEMVVEDYKIRKLLMDRLKQAGVARIEIERSINSVKLIVYVSRPGMVIGRAGTGIEELKKVILAFIVASRQTKHTPRLDVRIEPVKEPNLDAFLVAKNIADQLVRRLPHKRVMTQSVERVMNAGGKGVRIILSGRIAGAEISRREKMQKGTVPLSTLRARIEFASVPALTKKGYIGVKVWINKPEGK